MPIKNDEKSFEKNKTILALQMEFEEKKFYFLCYHHTNYFTFHVILQSDDLRDDQKFLFNLTIVDENKVCYFLYGTRLSEIGMRHIIIILPKYIYQCFENTIFYRV